MKSNKDARFEKLEKDLKNATTRNEFFKILLSSIKDELLDISNDDILEMLGETNGEKLNQKVAKLLDDKLNNAQKNIQKVAIKACS
ncbi:hypothetical protein IBE20_04565 [Francisella tularensis subsp. novicida]|uniref:Uncharacterized protein n=2 Tax=Francisella tularensis TaxID=263 RepID=A0A6I4RWD9_FRATU|nr:hypothetical protein [Francisella tularensis]AJI61365.1 putative m protein [Francisella tularensis subsp. novicida U112]EDX19139.1 M protein [Francisella tularensis subsp. novicida FTE]MBK2035068.1 hypothetical protein [Francisella tularensis subsp. novicida]MBK2116340.1 hypothetical protein [Francisella tularensis subsp. novicida]MBK2312180.1 hypothetical protein [Francisella tularensis subsp. novicida]